MSETETRSDVTTGDALRVTVVTPEGSAYDAEAESVVIPAHDGEVAFFRGHAPFVGALGAGELRVRAPGDEVSRFYLEGGVVQVLDNVVTVLAEDVIPAVEVDGPQADQELADALKMVPSTDEEFAARDHRIQTARARQRVRRGDPEVRRGDPEVR